MRRARPTLAIAGATVTAISMISMTAMTGCFAVNKRDADLDRSPVVNTGAGASIIYPGQTPPPHPGNLHPREAGYGQGVMANPGAPQSPPGAPPSPHAPTPQPPGASRAPAGAAASQLAVPPPEYTAQSHNNTGTHGSRSGGGSGGGGARISMLGGAEIEEERHLSINEEPKWWKYLALPFAVIAAPFEYGAEKVAGDPEPAPAVPRNEHQPRPEMQTGPPQVDYETARLQGMERELAQRGAPSSAPAPGATATPSPAPPNAAPSGAASGIAAELEALRRRANPAPVAPVQQAALAPTAATLPAPESVPPQSAPQYSAPPVAALPAPSAPAGAGQVDRDGDGRTDHWIQRENGAIVREMFDENFDTRPDRALLYDPQSHEVASIEEDTNFDGRIDSWTALRGGQVVGRRVDGNGDGQVDAWSFYRAGVITRLERDASGDGFRDHVAYYQDGRLVREERDDDNDGRTDLVTYFDDGERVERVEEDADGDGEIDVVSHYEGGRLARREVLDASVIGLGRARETGADHP